MDVVDKIKIRIIIKVIVYWAVNRIRQYILHTYVYALTLFIGVALGVLPLTTITSRVCLGHMTHMTSQFAQSPQIDYIIIKLIIVTIVIR